MARPTAILMGNGGTRNRPNAVRVKIAESLAAAAAALRWAFRVLGFAERDTAAVVCIGMVNHTHRIEPCCTNRGGSRANC